MSLWSKHAIFEKNSIILVLGVLVVISIGGLVEIVPLFYLKSTIEKVSGPVGEALIMTAAGLAVAIPAVLAYNVFGKLVGACEAELEGFAHDLREMLIDNSKLAA